MNIQLPTRLAELLDLSAVDPLSADDTSISKKACLADLIITAPLCFQTKKTTPAKNIPAFWIVDVGKEQH